MVWPARSGFAFFLGTRLAGGVLAMSGCAPESCVRVGRAPGCYWRAAGVQGGSPPLRWSEGRFFALGGGPGVIALLRPVARGATTGGPRVVAVATAAALVAAATAVGPAAAATTAAAAAGVAADLRG